MAWETLAVVSAEMKTKAEARQNRLGYDWTFGLRDSADDSWTGSYAAYCVGRANGLGISLEGISWTTLRSGYWWKSEGWWNSIAFAFFIGFEDKDESGNRSYYVVVDEDEYTIKLIDYNRLAATETIVDSTDNVMPLFGNINDWKHISFYHNKNTNSLKFWVNGEELLSGSILSYPDIDWFYVADHGGITDFGGYGFVDDLYFDISTISEVDDTPPARRYYPALPDGAGTYTQWTPDSGNNYERVDESGDPDDDTSYIATDTNGHVDTYTFAALVNVAPEASPDSAIVQAYVRTSPADGGIGSLKFKSRYAATDETTAAKRIRRQKTSGLYLTDPGTYYDWTVLSGYFDTQPGGGGEWTEAAFNGAEFGIESDGIV